MATAVQAQVSLNEPSGTYLQDFDTLATTGASNPWVDNATLPGWYAEKESGALDTYRGNRGSSFTGALYSYGADGSTERALGSLASTPPSGTGSIALGVRFLNTSGFALTDFTLSYTGEQWRDGGNTSTPNAQMLSFSYRVDTSATSPDVLDANVWTPVQSLDFVSPTFDASGPGVALDGNLSVNRQRFTDVPLTGLALQPGEELFLRWFDVNDDGSDHGLAIDDFALHYQAIPESNLCYALAGMAVVGLLLKRRASMSSAR